MAIELKLGKPDEELKTLRAFKVYFHPNMTPTALLGQWNKVPAEVKANYPTLTRQMDALALAYQTYRKTMLAYETAKKIYLQAQQVLEVASSVIYNPAMPAAFAGSVAANKIKDMGLQAIDTAKEFAYNKLMEALAK